jgi:PTS system galactitol-specific IIB component
MKKIFIVCATGIATSTMLKVKIQKFLESKDMEADYKQYRVAELSPDRVDADVIVSTTSIPEEIAEKAPVLNGLSLITGIGQDQLFEDLFAILNKE